MIPEAALDTLKAYVKYGVPPGDFMTAVLANDLMESFGKADERNRAALFDICSYIYNSVPRVAWGNYKCVEDWIKQGGMDGLKREVQSG